MNRSWVRARRYVILSCAVACWLQMPVVMADNATVTTDVVHVRGTWAEEQAKQESQQTTIITKKDIVKKQAKSVEDIVFSETGVSRTVDSMGRVRCIYPWCGSASYLDSCGRTARDGRPCQISRRR